MGNENLSVAPQIVVLCFIDEPKVTDMPTVEALAAACGQHGVGWVLRFDGCFVRMSKWCDDKRAVLLRNPTPYAAPEPARSELTQPMIDRAIQIMCGPSPGFNLHPDEVRDLWRAMNETP